MALSEHQASILKYLRSVECATKQQIYENSTMSYYHNWQKHAGDVLSRMVKQGLITRTKTGVYAIRGTGRKQSIEVENPNQVKLF